MRTFIAEGAVIDNFLKSDTHLAAADSPYVAYDNVVVESEATLTIEAGVTVKFAAGKGMDIYGRVVSDGQSDNPVEFMALDPPVWYPENNATVRLVDGDTPDRGTTNTSSLIPSAGRLCFLCIHFFVYLLVCVAVIQKLKNTFCVNFLLGRS